MSRLRYGDFMVEIADLATDILDDIRQQTSYYRASVYKSALNAGNHEDEPLQSGDCLVTMRVMRLLFDASKVVESMRAEARTHGSEGTNSNQTRRISTTITRHRRDLLAMSRQGSRSWSFLQSL
ncbi:MAG: hypothetical protein EBU49_07350 [Proteobacteria bacterium]|nr:hypothetical protein [Pseudomonadota bacterium]